MSYELPSILKAHNIFVEGMDMRGVIGDIERPKITQKMEDHRSGGMMGTVKIMQGLEALTMTITTTGYSANILKALGGQIDGKVFRFVGALEQDDKVGFKKLTGEAVGRITEADPGSDKQGDNGEHKFTIELVRYKESVDSDVLIDIDMLTNKFVVGGKDLYQGLNKALS